MNSFFANGKLLITGEYLVLNGALALAVPTKKGQTLLFEDEQGSSLNWESLDPDNNCWFSCKFSSKDLTIIKTSDQKKADFLQKLLTNASSIKNSPINLSGKVQTKLDFPRNWGLGSSSTLISCIAQWFNINPFLLHFSVSQGSGYDIACAQATSAISYKLEDGKPKHEQISWNPKFKDQLFFVHLNKKQDSQNEVKTFLKKNKSHTKSVLEITSLTKEIIKCNELYAFKEIISKHEQLMSNLLDTPTIKEKYFPDFNGVIKSLGAWGGDFILVCGDKQEKNYFINKGFTTHLDFENELININ